MSKTKEYSNNEVTIVWKPDACIHSGICVKGLGEVFKPKEKPWIKIDAASTEALIKQVKACPSGALSYYMNDAEDKEQQELETKVEVRENGPLLVYGTLKITHKDGKKKLKTEPLRFADVVLPTTNLIVMVRTLIQILKDKKGLQIIKL